jgi:hypothetical protein
LRFANIVEGYLQTVFVATQLRPATSTSGAFYMLMTYSEKLLTRKWQEKRVRIFERDNFKCKNECCKNKIDNQRLEIHHLMYMGGIDPWDYSNDMLITLCNVCHGKEINRVELEKSLANTFQMKGFLSNDLLALSSLIDTNNNFCKKLLNILRNFQNG